MELDAQRHQHTQRDALETMSHILCYAQQCGLIITPISHKHKTIKKGKGSPYSITERRVPELIPVLGSQPAGDTIRYDRRCYFNVRSKADISQLNLPHGTDN